MKLRKLLLASLLCSFVFGAAKTSVPPPDPSKLYCEPIVIDAFNRAWMSTGDGMNPQGEGTEEAGFRIDWAGGKLWVGPIIKGDAPLHVTIPVNGNTIAIAHVHPNHGVWTPSDVDMDGYWPDYVISSTGMNVTIPGKHDFTFLRAFLTWDSAKGCSTK